jgi:hypothetical protein
MGYLHTRVQTLLAPTEWVLHLLAHSLQDLIDQGNTLEDPLIQANRLCSLDPHVARHRCQDNPRRILCACHQDLTVPTPTSHLTHLDNQLWSCYTRSPLAFQDQG